MNLLPPRAFGDLLKRPYVLLRIDLHLSIIMLTCYLFVLNKLWTLCTFWLSFGSLDPLFSSLYRLFCKKTRGVGYLDWQNSDRLSSRERIGKLIMGINHWISRVTHGVNIDAPYHLC
jgi:hypothetical protein